MGHVTPQFKFARIRRAFSRFFKLPHPVNPASSPEIKNQRGSALVMAAIFMMIATVLITVGMKLVTVSNQQSTQANLYVGEAENVARAGLVDALGWLRRNSSTSPVKAA